MEKNYEDGRQYDSGDTYVDEHGIKIEVTAVSYSEDPKTGKHINFKYHTVTFEEAEKAREERAEADAAAEEALAKSERLKAEETVESEKK